MISEGSRWWLCEGKIKFLVVFKNLSFGTSAEVVSGGDETQIIGHPGGGGDWAIVNRDISNRVGRDITLDPSIASRFSGGPMLVDGKVMGIVMSSSGAFGLGITHKSILNYVEGFGVVPQSTSIMLPEQRKVPSGSGSSGKGGFDAPKIQPGNGGFDIARPQSKPVPDGMVLVPASEFTIIGSPNGLGKDDEHPEHLVHIGAFYMDQYEVTVEKYMQFIVENDHEKPWYFDEIDFKRDAKKPVVGVTWYEADAYCKWAGKRLPTEAEWKRQRGEIKVGYILGGNQNPTPNRANFKQLTNEFKSLEKAMINDRKLDQSEGNLKGMSLVDVGSYEDGKPLKGFTIWPVTFLNGFQIGMGGVTITHSRKFHLILLARPKVNSKCTGVEIGLLFIQERFDRSLGQPPNQILVIKKSDFVVPKTQNGNDECEMSNAE